MNCELQPTSSRPTRGHNVCYKDLGPKHDQATQTGPDHLPARLISEYSELFRVIMCVCVCSVYDTHVSKYVKHL